MIAFPRSPSSSTFAARARRMPWASGSSGTNQRSGRSSSPASKVLYAALCSFLGHGQINRRDLRGALKSCTDEEIARALEELIRHKLLVPADRVTNSGTLPGYSVRSIEEFEG